MRRATSNARRPASGRTIARPDRRTFLRLSAMSAALPAATLLPAAPAEALQPAVPRHDDHDHRPHRDLEEKTIVELQSLMASRRLSSLELTNAYLRRIGALDVRGPKLNSVIEINPEARHIARRSDMERAATGPRGILHGIPFLLKDNIDTGDQMRTSAGSLALTGSAPVDSTVAERLRRAGAVILGKANLSEWANFRGFMSSSGWSGRGGQTNNPYALPWNPCGSSSGSAAAVSANLASVAIGTETDGSIVCPSSICGVVGIKPTVGLVSRAGVIPISHSQDTVGPHARTVADAAAVLGALTGVDPRDPATAESAGHFFTDYTQFLDAAGLQGARLGVARGGGFTGYSPETDAVFEEALQVLSDAGAVLVDPADIPTVDLLRSMPFEIIVLVYEFKRDLNAYLATRPSLPVHTLADLIAFNIANADRELKFFGQEIFELSESDPFTEAEYLSARAESLRLSTVEGIDLIMDTENLDALVAPTGSPAWPTDLINGDHFIGASSDIAAQAGYPLINVPAGDVFGLPVGISFMGRRWSEDVLIKLAYAFEQAANARRKPRFLDTLDFGGRTRTAFSSSSSGLGAAQAGRAAAERRTSFDRPRPPRFLL
jgi:amidase